MPLWLKTKTEEVTWKPFSALWNVVITAVHSWDSFGEVTGGSTNFLFVTAFSNSTLATRILKSNGHTIVIHRLILLQINYFLMSTIFIINITGSLTEAIIAQHSSLRGIARQLAEVYYIVGAQQLDGYGQECFLAKGQLILKRLFVSSSWPKTQRNFLVISALASKKRCKKIRFLYTANWMILFWLSYTTFLIWPLFRG